MTGNRLKRYLLCALMTLSAGVAFAQPSTAGAGGPPAGQGQSEKGGPGGGERPRGPPPEAIAACKGIASGAACSFNGRENQKMSGTCGAPPPGGGRPPSGDSGKTETLASTEGGPLLACRPARNGPPGEPPKR